MRRGIAGPRGGCCGCGLSAAKRLLCAERRLSKVAEFASLAAVSRGTSSGRCRPSPQVQPTNILERKGCGRSGRSLQVQTRVSLARIIYSGQSPLSGVRWKGGGAARPPLPLLQNGGGRRPAFAAFQCPSCSLRQVHSGCAALVSLKLKSRNCRLAFMACLSKSRRNTSGTNCQEKLLAPRSKLKKREVLLSYLR